MGSLIANGAGLRCRLSESILSGSTLFASVPFMGCKNEND